VGAIENQFGQQVAAELDEQIKMLQTNATIRDYGFHELRDLHTFQSAITGFSVAFDGIASTFAISRRRMVVPIYKKWEAQTPRLQILTQGGGQVIQLAAFFHDFSHGDCMNFALKRTDNFETSSKGGKFYIRIVDAKFALPRKTGEKAREEAEETEGGREGGWVCLDMPDFPGEHDDILIAFDTEQGESPTNVV
jgi:hypothetical protein